MKRDLTITMMTTLAQRRQAASFAAEIAWASNGNPGAALSVIAERVAEEVSRASVLLAAMDNNEIVALAAIRIGPRSLHPLDRRRCVSRYVRQVRDAQAVAFVELFRRNEIGEQTAARLMNAAAIAVRALDARVVVMVSDEQVEGAQPRASLSACPVAHGTESTALLAVAEVSDLLSTPSRATAAA